MEALRNCRIFDGERFISSHAVLTENGKIICVCREDDERIQTAHKLDLGGALLVPGFLDLQANGGGGVLFNDSPSPKTVMKIYEAHRKGGTALMCPTFITDSEEKLHRAIQSVDETAERIIPALHIEGFFISERKSGIHDKDFIISPTPHAISSILSQGKRKKIFTVAPEVFESTNGDFPMLQMFTAANCTVFGGHTDAECDTFLRFLKCGGAGATHLYNAMSGLSARKPGAIGAVLTCEKGFSGIIADGYHVDYACVRLAKKTLGDRLFLVTDAMPPACSDMREYKLQGQMIKADDGVCRSEEGVIAGSCLSMIQAVRNCIIHCDISAEEAIKMASLYPALAIGKTDTGRICAGYDAAFTVTNESFTEAEGMVM